MSRRDSSRATPSIFRSGTWARALSWPDMTACRAFIAPLRRMVRYRRLKKIQRGNRPGAFIFIGARAIGKKIGRQCRMAGGCDLGNTLRAHADYNATFH